MFRIFSRSMSCYRVSAFFVAWLSFLSIASAERYFTQQFSVPFGGSDVLREIHVSIASNDDLTEHRLTAMQDVLGHTRREILNADYYVDISRDDVELFHSIEFTLEGTSRQQLPEVTYGRDLSWPNQISGQYRVHRRSDDGSVIARDWSQPYDAVELGTRSHFFELIEFETIERRESAHLLWQAGEPGISFVPTVPHEEVVLDGATFEIGFSDEVVSWNPGWRPGQSLGLGTGAVVLRERWPGDANLDDRFESADLVQVFQAGKYATGRPASWADGDWNVDGVFDSGDLVAAFQGGAYEQDNGGEGSLVPEPTSLWLLMAAMTGIAIRRRHVAR